MAFVPSVMLAEFVPCGEARARARTGTAATTRADRHLAQFPSPRRDTGVRGALRMRAFEMRCAASASRTLLIDVCLFAGTAVHAFVRWRHVFGRLGDLANSAFLARSLRSLYFYLSTDKKAYCEALAAKIASVSDLPAICKTFDTVQEMLQKRKTVVDPFAGMKGATQARADRSSGREHHAVIQRRMTTGAITGTSRFSKLDK